MADKKEPNVEDKVKEKRPFPKWVSILIVIISLLEVLFIIFLFVISIVNNVSFRCYEKIAESSLLASGIAIIGVAIAVWAGLNIVNYLDKRDLEEWKANKEEEFNKRTKNQNEQIKKLNDNNTFQQSQIQSLQQSMREMFLQALLDNSNEIMTAYFYEQFQSNNNSNYNYGNLIPIEQTFSQVYDIYYHKIFKDDLLIRIAQIGIDKINMIINSESHDGEKIFHDLLKGYLIFRKAEFLYYIGRKSDSNKTKRTTLKIALDIYLKFSYAFQIYIPKYAEDDNGKKYTGEEGKRKISVYIANTIGHIYSSLYEFRDEGKAYNAENQEYLERAEFYYSCVEKWATGDLQREVYFRNHGVNKEKSGNLQAAKELYMKAINTGDINRKTLHCIISVYDKIINETLKIGYVSKESTRTIPLGSQKYFDSIKNLDADSLLSLEKSLNDLKNYSSKAKDIFSKYHDGYLYMAIYYRDLIIVGTINNMPVAERMMLLESANKEISSAKLLNPQYDLTMVIEKDLKSLSEMLTIGIGT